MEKKESLFDILSNIKDTKSHYFILNKYINYKMGEKRIPYYASLELSPICNFNCQMCYIRTTASELDQSGQKILRFSDWKLYIDGLCDLGTENFVLTGGECMLHPDFIRIYEYIYDRGKNVSMITNGSCLTDRILDTFIVKPPKNVFLTIYGTSEDVYERFCENGNAFFNVSENIDKFISKKMPVNLICTLGNGNIDDFDNIKDFGKKRGLKVRFGADLMEYGRCDDRKLKKSKIDIFQRKKNDFDSFAKSEDANERDFYKSYVFPEVENVNVYTSGIPCVSAKYVCSISWRGTMRPCVTFEPFSLDPRTDGGIKECWQKIVDWGNSVPLIIECQKCLFRNECMPCLALHYNATHEYGKVSEKHCFKVQHPEEAAKLQAEYDRRQAEKAKSAENNNKTETTPDQGVVS